jgi:hypothetical protein
LAFYHATHDFRGGIVDIIQGQRRGGFVVFTDQDRLRHAVRLGAVLCLSDTDDPAGQHRHAAPGRPRGPNPGAPGDRVGMVMLVPWNLVLALLPWLAGTMGLIVWRWMTRPWAPGPAAPRFSTGTKGSARIRRGPLGRRPWLVLRGFMVLPKRLTVETFRA